MFKRLLEKRAQALDEAQLPYMIIGGQAVFLYGEPRLTKDIDITLGATVDRLDVVLKVAKQVGFTPLVDPGSFVDQTRFYLAGMKKPAFAWILFFTLCL